VNARDAIADAGTIFVETSQTTLDAEYVAAHSGAREGLHVAITVSDTGSGFDETIRERIFEPFFTTKPPGVGTGLGLSTVHGIVAQSGGNIWIYSEPGRGTTFKVYIPVAPGAVAGDEPEAPPEQPAPVRGAAVLVVEDDEAVRRLTTRILADAGYEVVSAASTDVARDALCAHSIDLVLSDLVLPGGTGERLAGCTDRRGARPPVIFMSGYTASSVTREELLTAESRYIEKPFSPASLLSIVAETLNEERSRPLARPA
jgi:two-component system cell cycle sensor histidine kinase/response regulator CckA